MDMGTDAMIDRSDLSENSVKVVREMPPMQRELDPGPQARTIVVTADDPAGLRATILEQASKEIEAAFAKFRYSLDLLEVVDFNAKEKYARLDRELRKAVNEITERM